MTLLENLLLVDGKKGGTIHQYIDIRHKNYEDLVEALNRDYYSHEFSGAVSYGTLNHYAEKRSIHINWSKETIDAYGGR